MRAYLSPLRRLTLGLACLLSSLAAVAQAQQIPSFLWAKSGGGTGDDHGYHIELDAAGNAYMAGIFSGVASFETSTLTSQGYYDVYLAKYDAQGRFLWVRQLGGIGNENAFGLLVDATGNAYITGRFTPPPNVRNQASTITIGTTTLTGGALGEMFLAKYDPQGNALWARQTLSPTGGSIGQSIALDKSGNVYLAGTMTDVVRFDHLAFNTNAGVFIAKYDAQGTVQWVKNDLGGSLDFFVKTIAVSATGELYLAGVYFKSLTLGTTTLPAPAARYSDLYLAKFDSQGNPIWVKPFIGLGFEDCDGLTLDPVGNIVLAISFHNTISHANHTFTVQGPSTTSNSDVLVLKYNPAGNLLWSRQLGGPATFGPTSYSNSDSITGLDTDSQGNIYLVALLIGMPTLTTYDGTNTFNNHFICYSPAGAVRWTRRTSPYSSAIAVMPCGEIVLTGDLEYSNYFDQITLKSLGHSDAYVAKLSASKLVFPTADCSPIVTDGDSSGSDQLIIPTIITPNGDTQNEFFYLQGLPTGPWQINIYNRWGARVYHADDYRQDWNAPGLPDGQYFYYLQAPNRAAIKGWLEVIH